MVKEILRTYYISMKAAFPDYKWVSQATQFGPWLPKKIVIFRNGASDADFRDVLDREIRQLLPMFWEVHNEQAPWHPEYFANVSSYEPRLTVVAVQKNHGTRLFPAPPPPGAPGRPDPLENVPPGTVVDTEITSGSDRDFFLVSHAAIPGGTVRPTHYRVLLDDEDKSADILEVFCYRRASLETANGCNDRDA